MYSITWSLQTSYWIYCCVLTERAYWIYLSFLISNFRRVLNTVCILLGISSASDCFLPTFRNPLSVPSSRAGCRVVHILHPALEDGTDRGFRNVGKPQSDAGEIPKEYIQYLSMFYISQVVTSLGSYSSPNIVRVIKSRRMRLAGHVSRMGEERGAYRFLVGKPERKRPLGRPRRRWVDYIRMDLQ